MEPIATDGSKFRAGFVLLLVAAVSLLFFAVVAPFLKALLFGAILSGLFQPLYRWLLQLFRGRATLASLTTIVLLVFLLVGPVSGLATIVVTQAVQVSERAAPWFQDQLGATSNFDLHDWLVGKFPFAADFVPSNGEIAGHVTNAVKAVGSYLVGSASAFTAVTAGLLLDLFVMIYAMFFFLKDGRRILEKIFYYMPLGHEDELLMLHRFASITKATVKGTLLIGLIQGSLAGVAFGVLGIGGAAFWGTIMVILSIVPGIGAALVWVPAVIYLFIQGSMWKGIILFIWCAAVVGTIDNVLRPTLVGKDAKMPDLLILIGTLGGLFFFGPLGLIVGPIVCGLFLTVWEIYGVTFKNLLPPAQSLRDFDVKSQPPRRKRPNPFRKDDVVDES